METTPRNVVVRSRNHFAEFFVTPLTLQRHRDGLWLKPLQGNIGQQRHRQAFAPLICKLAASGVEEQFWVLQGAWRRTDLGILAATLVDRNAGVRGLGRNRERSVRRG